MLIYNGFVNCVGSVCVLVVLAVFLLFVELMILVVVEAVRVLVLALVVEVVLFVLVVEGCVVTRFNKKRLNVKANRLCLCKVKT